MTLDPTLFHSEKPDFLGWVAWCTINLRCARPKRLEQNSLIQTQMVQNIFAHVGSIYRTPVNKHDCSIENE